MRERPILFSGPMIRALLDGSKTQTRRVVKVDHSWTVDDDRADAINAGHWWFHTNPNLPGNYHVTCPYGLPGDRLWVREPWRASSAHNNLPPRDIPVRDAIEYGADRERVLTGKLRAARFMPRWASRIALELTDVRVERLQDISEADAIAEGVARSVSGYWHNYAADGPTHQYARDSYRSLWESLNASRGFGWDVNPWVWALTFKRVEAEAVAA